MVDIDLIKKQVKRVIEFSQDIKDAKVDYLIDTWYEAKKDFIEIFGEKLIYKTDEKITIDLSEEQKQDEVEKFCLDTSNAFPRYQDLIRFIRRNQNDFFQNILQKPYDEDGYHIPAGMKISKAFKEFISDKEDLYLIQTAASRVIQEGKITGYLCLSVHPLDYLSSSENNYKWRSCHALDGEYRSGNLSYMLDKSTIVCYLCGDKDTILPRFPDEVPWNNKKWRMLLFVSENKNALFAGRHYPFFSKTLMEEIRVKWAYLNWTDLPAAWWLTPPTRAHENWSHWHNDNFKKITFAEWGYPDNFTLKSRYIPMRNEIYDINKLIDDGYNPLHFNDLLNSSFYIPYYCWFKWSDQPIHFTIGHRVKCVCCENEYLTKSETMLCDDCLENNGIIVCGDCGCVMRDEDVIYVESEDRYICRTCFEEYYNTCACCGEVFHNDDIVYDENSDNFYCRECYKEMRDSE